MQKTKRITINATDDVTINSSKSVTVIRIEDPNLQDLLMEISEEDLSSFIQWNGNKPENIFDEASLIKWAQENGYIKE